MWAGGGREGGIGGSGGEGWKESLNASLHNTTISHPEEMVSAAMHTVELICSIIR